MESNFIIKADINGNLITYKVYFENIGNYNIYNFLLKIYIPDNTTFCKNKIYINKKKVEDKYLYGIRVKELPAKSKVEVEYTVEILESINVDNIYNRCKVSFKTDKDEEKEEYSNNVIVSVEDIKSNSSSCEVALQEVNNYREVLVSKRGEKVVYSTKIKNISPVYVDEIKIVIEELEEIQLEAQYIKIRNEMKKIYINKKIYIDELAPNEEIEIFFNFTILEEFRGNKLEIDSNIKYVFMNDKGKVVNSNLQLDTIMVILEEEDSDYYLEDILLTFRSDDEAILKGDTRVYDIVIENRNTKEFKGAFLNIKYVKGTYIDSNKIKLNNIYINVNEIEAKEDRLVIRLGTVLEKTIYNIQYEAMYNNVDNRLKDIETCIKVSGYYDSGSNAKKSLRNYDKVLREKIESASLKVFINADKDMVVKGEDIVYRSTIINDGTLVEKIKYYLNTSKGLSINRENIMINGVIYNNILKDNKLILKLQPGDGINIEFIYKYIRSYGKRKVFAQGIVEYECESNKFNVSGIIKSDEIYVDAAITTFKELLIEESVDVFKISPPLKEIIRVHLESETNDFYVIDTRRNTFNDTKIIGKKVRMRGNLKIIIEYSSDIDNQITNLYYKEKFFSTTIQLPEDYVDGELNDIKIDVIDVYYKLINNEKIFINANILINTNI